MFSIHRLRRKSALNGAFLATSASIAALVTACGGSGATTSSPIAVPAASASPALSSPSPAPIGQAGFVLGTAATKVGMTSDTNDTEFGGTPSFLPKAVTVQVGDIVEWDYDPMAFIRHNIVFADAPAVSNPKGLGAGDSVARGDGTWQVRFTHAGVYNYVCTFHAGMTGTVTVR